MFGKTNHKIQENTHLVKRIAKELGFDFCGISKAEFLEEEAPLLERWLKNGMHGKMQYMENHFDKRLDPTLLVPGAKSVISLMYNYYPKQKQFENDNYLISKYAYGEDYHHVIKALLKSFHEKLKVCIGDVDGRVFVDSAPVLDKAWAKKSGIAWMGKNTNMINPQAGSFFFLAELILDVELVPDGPIKDYCGTCTRCIDACPTEAITDPYIVDGSKCISYLTIELKDEIIPNEFQGKLENWIFGCDICQDVCPWNRFAKPHGEQKFTPNPKLFELSIDDWEDLNKETFQELFRKSAVKRTKFEGLQRNIGFQKL